MTKHTFSACSSCGSVNRIDAIKALSSTPSCGQCKKPLAMHKGIVDIGLDELDKLAKVSDIPIVVDLWASWCGPCVAFAPVFEKVAQEKAGDFVFAKINTEKHAEVTGVLGVRGIPTLIAFNRGDEVKRQSGAMPEAMFKAWLQGLG